MPTKSHKKLIQFKYRPTKTGIPIVEIRQSYDSLISNL